MRKSDAGVLKELEAGPATTDQIAEGSGLARVTVQATVRRLYSNYHIAKGSLYVEWGSTSRNVARQSTVRCARWNREDCAGEE